MERDLEAVVKREDFSREERLRAVAAPLLKAEEIMVYFRLVGIVVVKKNLSKRRHSI